MRSLRSLRCPVTKRGEEGSEEQTEEATDDTKEVTRPCLKYSIKAREAAIKKLGIARGGKGYDFLGNWGTKGCYAYKSGTYVNHAYYGTGGTSEQVKAKVSGTKFRPKGYDCQKD